MSIIYLLIPIAILLTALGIYLFFWAVKSEQFDDLEKQGMSILFDDDKPSPEEALKIDEKVESVSSKTNQKDQ
ncbi:cbb3-type cytochrome oxidase assembly protein CcoS [Colwellia sp. RSH04]|uniref:cbb3-type cytochrome oxidase assembly protein CcoS n=1 Tax=Colwellia sp. RSH04 TaxID=2305464 RepID=UPI000E5886F9|nr:cbb3-type cytochrome oxidase assembly protein CcoS [Colwellia sp. RSH04]RHW77002.1 cbb3-type cytochrome oxidase assembly protein CcoS [Colwellia sp. RSH04]